MLVWFSFSLERGELQQLWLLSTFGGEEESSLFLPLVFILLINKMGCLGGWLTLFLFSLFG
jgi:hypothetical protein